MTGYKRQNQDRFKRVPDNWRRPKGRQSKQRLSRKGKPAVPCVGRRQPEEERDLHPSGLKEKLVHNADEAKRTNPETTAVRIGTQVGGRKREHIEEECEKRGIKVLNGSGGEE